MRGVSLAGIADELRFVDEGPEKLTVSEGAVNPREPKIMRELSARSADELRRVWAEGHF
jgi:hypothetical protein